MSKIIYQPRGRAGEYGNYAANLFTGCVHGCEYCYAPDVLRMDRKEFHAEVSVRANVLAQLERDAFKLRQQGVRSNVFLCFTTDPYQPIEAELKITRSAIKILNGHGLGVTILTKAGRLARRDLDLLAADPRNEFGVTLTHDHPDLARAWEPNAASPDDRIDALTAAWAAGIKTWISMEPVVDPAATIRMVKRLALVTGTYRVGKLNRHPHAKTINWPLFRHQVVRALKETGKQYVIKKDLQEAV